VRDPFLFDECLYPGLIAIAHERGHHATHVVHRGLQGTEDQDLVPVVLAGSFVFVTSNGRDFLRLYAEQEVHPGLIVILPGNLERNRQITYFAAVLDAIEPLDDLVNKVVHIASDFTVEITEWPQATR